MNTDKEPRRNNLTAPTWRGLSVCRIPTHRDALWCTSGWRPDESGRGRHECLRHGGPTSKCEVLAWCLNLRAEKTSVGRRKRQSAVPGSTLEVQVYSEEGDQAGMLY